MRAGFEVVKLTKRDVPGGVVGIEDRLDAPLGPGDALASEVDPLGRLVGQFEIGDCGERDALGDKVAVVDPASHDALRVAERADRQVLAGVAKASLDEAL
jgi:hypothetical protein